MTPKQHYGEKRREKKSDNILCNSSKKGKKNYRRHWHSWSNTERLIMNTDEKLKRKKKRKEKDN